MFNRSLGSYFCLCLHRYLADVTLDFMKYRDVERGVCQEDEPLLEKALTDLETELMFIPASQERTTIQVDTLVQLIRAAKDGLMARPLFEALEPASEELYEIGREHVSGTMGRVTAQYLCLHPEIDD